MYHAGRAQGFRLLAPGVSTFGLEPTRPGAWSLKPEA